MRQQLFYRDISLLDQASTFIYKETYEKFQTNYTNLQSKVCRGGEHEAEHEIARAHPSTFRRRSQA